MAKLEGFVTIEAAAKHLKMRPATLRSWIERGEVPFIQFGTRARPVGAPHLTGEIVAKIKAGKLGPARARAARAAAKPKRGK